VTATDRQPAAARILADLRPVTPIGRPWRRTLAVVPVAVAMAVAVALGYGVRRDSSQVGALVLWGLSALQVVYGIVLVGIALRTSVPGRELSRAATTAAFAAAVGLVAAITGATWLAHASRVPAGAIHTYFTVCFRTPMAVGVPALALTLTLAFRAYPTRPALTGALAGLGAGLLADGSWRTFCEVTDPVHVATSHLAAVAVLTAAGMAAAWLAARRRASTSMAADRIDRR
jgi:hypothetical protein